MSDRTETLTKEDVARRVAEKMDCPLYKAKPWVRAVLMAMGDLLVEADPERRLELRDFGSYCPAIVADVHHDDCRKFDSARPYPDSVTDRVLEHVGRRLPERDGCRRVYPVPLALDLVNDREPGTVVERFER